MRKIIFSALLLSTVAANAQTAAGMVGVNTENPKATLHIEAGDSESKGLIIPRISADEMKTMSSLPHFGYDQHAIIVYLLSNMPEADRTGKLEKVDEYGYYSYNAYNNKWQKFGAGEQDLRYINGNNHLTLDAGIGNNGTSLGNSTNNIAIGPNFTGFANKTDLAGSGNIALGIGIYNNNGGTMLGNNNTGIGGYMYQMQNGGKMQGGNNVALGSRLFNLDKAGTEFRGSNNMALGYNLFYLNNGDLIGYNNTAIGNGHFNVNNGDFTGYHNISIGNNSSGTYNGAFSGNYNIVLGYNSMTANGPISGSNNIAIGNNSLNGGVSGITGSDNISIGNGFYNNLGEGNGNIVIRTNSGPDTPGVPDNVILIGNGSSSYFNPSTKDGTVIIVSNAYNAPIILGDSGYHNRVGIGTNDPKAKLDVNGSIRLSVNYSNCTSDNIGTIEFRGTDFYGCTHLGWKKLNND